MSAPDPAAFARSLAALAPESFVRFVAAAEAARGEVTAVDREGGVLVVHGRETRRVLPVAARRGPLRPPAPVGPVDGSVDEVVAQVDDDAARSLAARHGARHRSPDDLRDRVLYGLDRPTGRRLLATHLDGQRPDRRGAAAWLVALAAVAVVLAAVAGAGVAPTPGDGPPAAVPSAADGGGSTAGTVADGYGDGDYERYPPGVTVAGVRDAEALAAAHRAAATNRSYRWVVVGGRSAGDVPPDRAGGARRTLDAILRRSKDRSGNGSGSFRTYAAEDYAYVGLVGPNGSRYTHETMRHRPGDGSEFGGRAADYVARYLAAPDVSVVRVDAAAATVYRIRVAGPPRRLTGPVSNYAATAVVTREGFVVRLGVTYTRHADDGTRTVALRFAYAPYRDDVRARWHEAAERAANVTTPAGTSTPVPAAVAAPGRG